MDFGAGVTVCDAVISVKYNDLCFTARTTTHKYTGGKGRVLGGGVKQP